MEPSRILPLACLLAISLGCTEPKHTAGMDPKYERPDYMIAMAASSVSHSDNNRAIELADSATKYGKLTLTENLLMHEIQATAMLRLNRFAEASGELELLSKLLRSDASSLAGAQDGNYAAELAAANSLVAAHANRSDVYFIRAGLYLRGSQPDRAIEDCEIGLRLALTAMPLHPELRAAWEQFKQARYQKVIDDIGDVTKASFHPYKLLLLHLARAKLGQNDELSLREAGLSKSPEAWPSPVLALYLGQIDLAGLLAAADNAPNREIRAGQLCEANFYAGEFEILHGRVASGAKLLETAEADCPDGLYEGRAATTELARAIAQGG